jgi:hypothetical protein
MHLVVANLQNLYIGIDAESQDGGADNNSSKYPLTRPFIADF